MNARFQCVSSGNDSTSRRVLYYNARCALQQALHFVASRTVSINDKALPPSGVEVSYTVPAQSFCAEISQSFHSCFCFVG